MKRERSDAVPIAACIAAYEQTRSVAKAGRLVGLNGSSLHERLRRAGYQMPTAQFTEAEVARIRREYNAFADAYRLDELAQSMGRTKGAICRIAGRLGMTNAKRKVPTDKGAAMAQRTRDWIKANGHHRGALGMRHSEHTKAILSMKSAQMWADPTSKVNADEHRQRISDRCVQMTVDRIKPVGYSRTASGRRADLGDAYFRSSWEANYARYLNLLVRQRQIVGWQYEVKTFVFETITRGTRTYTPDFRVERLDGGVEWHEVKGWMDPKSKTRLASMSQDFPEERVIVIDESWFRSAVTQGLPGMLPGWEFKGKKTGAVTPGVHVAIHPLAPPVG